MAKPFAHSTGASIDQRQNYQDHRLNQGERSGSLTRREANRLEHRQSAIEATEARMRADGGGLSLTERVRLQSSLNRQSQAIYNQKHDAQTRRLVRR
jgi:hypothetical protein